MHDSAATWSVSSVSTLSTHPHLCMLHTGPVAYPTRSSVRPAQAQAMTTATVQAFVHERQIAFLTCRPMGVSAVSEACFWDAHIDSAAPAATCTGSTHRPVLSRQMSEPPPAFRLKTILFHCTGKPEVVLGFQVTKQGVQLVEPHIRRLSALRGRTYSAASALLFELMQLGLYLVPQLRDAEPAGLHLKVHSCLYAVRLPCMRCTTPVQAVYHSCTCAVSFM